MTTVPAASRVRRRFRRFVSVALLALVVAGAGGCAHKPKPRAARPPKPWMEARSLCVFPMAPGGSARTAASLESSMTAGWKSRIGIPADADVVRIEGASAFPTVDVMTIDLTDATIDMKRKTKKLKPVGKSEGSVRVENLEFVANPLRVQNAELRVGMTATDARLDFRRDKSGRPMLTLSDARDGQLSLEVTKKDIDAMILKSARESAGKFGVSVDRTKLKLDVVDGKSIRADLKLDTRLGILPAGLRFKAHLDVDEKLNGKITRLSCEGDQLLGPIISGFINPALQKYEGKKRPLVGFPWGEMKLKDFELRLDDSFHMDVKFGRGPVQTASRAPSRSI